MWIIEKKQQNKEFYYPRKDGKQLRETAGKAIKKQARYYSPACFIYYSPKSTL
jgi:hypothetical protein